MVDRDRRCIRNDVGGHSPFDEDHLQLIFVLNAVENDGPRLILRDARDDISDSMDGVSTRERPRRVRPAAHHIDAHSQRALTTGLHDPRRRLSQNRHITANEIGSEFDKLDQS